MENRLTKLFRQRRGYSDEYLETINNYQHQKLQDIDKMTDILKRVHDEAQRIVVMPDFDTDGIDAGVLGFAGLSELGFKTGLYRPHPENGYGIGVDDIKAVQREFPDVKYIISCDVGITCYDAFFYAESCGIKVLITDHHEEQRNKPMAIYTASTKTATTLDEKVEPIDKIYNYKTREYKPNAGDRFIHVGKNALYAHCIVNPCRLTETYKLRDICGAFVLYQLLMEYAHRFESIYKQEQIRRLCIFAGFGTIGDVEPLVHENRRLLKNTISMLKFIYNNDDSSVVDSLNGCDVYKRAFRGLFALLHTIHANNKSVSQDGLTAKFIGWTIAPIFNSIKRMGMPMQVIFGVFFANDYKSQLANSQMVINANERRKQTVADDLAKILAEQAAGLQPYAPFIYYTDAPGGVLGLLASQLQDKTGFPTFVINRDNLAGSGRSFSYFPVITKLAGTEFRVAGHEQAFGIQFTDHEQVKRFYDYLVQNILPLVKENAGGESSGYDLCLTSGKMAGKNDGELDEKECSEFHQDMLALAPWGSGFEEPVIKVLFDPNDVQITKMGSTKEHLKIILPNNMQLIAWNQAELADKLSQSKLDAFVGDFSFNNFMGKVSLQMIGDFYVENGDKNAENQ